MVCLWGRHAILPGSACVLEGLNCLNVINLRWVEKKRHKGDSVWKESPEYRVLNPGSEF